MRKILPAFLAFVFVFSFSCSKNSNSDNPGMENTSAKEIANATPAAAVFYDFVITTNSGCNGHVLTINDCGDGSYKNWTSTKNCTTANQFNGLVAGSGNPLLSSNPATFPYIGATYIMFNNTTTAVRDALFVTFKTGYNASHKPTVSYNPTTRKFTITNAGNPSFVTVSKASFSGLIGPGYVEFC
jgi:hypothetical protein